jgi:hypothetical protein
MMDYCIDLLNIITLRNTAYTRLTQAFEQLYEFPEQKIRKLSERLVFLLEL